jgi:uncharacterized hydrophobic protein (TIGR00271 family)
VIESTSVIHLRLVVSSEEIDHITRELAAMPGVAHVARVDDASITPRGHLVFCDVAREAANEVIEWLQDRGIHHTGAIVVNALDAVISDAAADADRRAPGHGGDALIWEEVEARAREDADLTLSFLVFITVAAMIAGVGILLDAPILIVGAMVVGPEYGPLAALCVAFARRRHRPAIAAARTLLVGLAAAALATLVATVMFRVTGLAPERYEIGERQLTAFISRPDGMAAVVAILAGIVGMLSLTEARGGSLIGVLVSVTTIPAVANVGLATAYRKWSEVGGAALQLTVNLFGLCLAGVATLVIQARATTVARRRGRRPRYEHQDFGRRRPPRT